MLKQADGAAIWSKALAIRARRDLSSAEKDALRGLPFRVRSLSSGEVFAHEGDAPQSCALVMAGTLCQIKLTRSGSRQIIGLRLSNEFVGIIGLFLREADHDVQALTSCHLMELDVTPLRRLMDAQPALRELMAADAMVAASIAQEWMINIGRRDARQRVAHFLCELAIRLEGTMLKCGNTYELPLRQEQIADAVGLHRVAVNRMVRGLAADGLIAARKNAITILDAGKLEEVADFSARYLHLGQSVGDRRKRERVPLAA
jgi:CRP-like cAMP-binding protein